MLEDWTEVYGGLQHKLLSQRILHSIVSAGMDVAFEF